MFGEIERVWINIGGFQERTGEDIREATGVSDGANVTKKCCGKVNSILTAVSEKEAVKIEEEKHAVSGEDRLDNFRLCLTDTLQ